MKKIFMLLPDSGGCGHYRAALPARHCQSDQWQLDLKDFWHEDDVLDYAAFVFHRFPKPGAIDHLKQIKDYGGKIAWELDDSLKEIPRWNPVSRSITEENLRLLDEALDLADYIWVSTTHLASVVGRPEKTRVLPNLLDLNEWKDAAIADKPPCPLTVLWAGSGCHWADLTLLVEPYRRLMERYGSRVNFVFFGDIPEEFAKYRRIMGSLMGRVVSALPSVGLVDPAPLAQYAQAMRLLNPHICVAPLCAEPFNRSKSCVKWLEYSACGGLTVASAGGPYDAIRHGEDGLLVRDVGEWFDLLCYAIENDVPRRKMAAAANQRLRSSFSWQSETARHPWIEAFGELAQ